MTKDKFIADYENIDNQSGDEPGDLQLALIQMSTREEDRDANVNKAVSLVERAAQGGAALIVLPEFFNTEYFYCRKDIKYFEYAEAEDGPTLSAISNAARKQRTHIVATIYERARNDHYFDTAFIIDDHGDIVGRYRKIHPGGFRSLEKMYFRGGSDTPVFDVLGWRIGISICYDNLFPETARGAVARGAELVLAPFASAQVPFWDELFVARAVENAAYYAVCNKVGPELDEFVCAGRSKIVGPTGAVLAQAGSDADELLTAVLHKRAVKRARQTFCLHRDRRPEAYTAICERADQIC